LYCLIQAPTGEIDRYENHSVDQTPLGYMVKWISVHGGCLGSQRRWRTL